MNELSTAASRVSQARDLPAVLDAASDGFEEILTVIGGFEEATATLVAAFLLAATQAANGRDAVLFAPSLPPRPAHRDRRPRVPDRGSVHQITVAVAGLSEVLATQLTRAAATAAGPGDRAACHQAAICAARITDLMAQAGP